MKIWDLVPVALGLSARTIGKFTSVGLPLDVIGGLAMGSHGIIDSGAYSSMGYDALDFISLGGRTLLDEMGEVTGLNKVFDDDFSNIVSAIMNPIELVGIILKHIFNITMSVVA